MAQGGGWTPVEIAALCVGFNTDGRKLVAYSYVLTALQDCQSLSNEQDQANMAYSATNYSMLYVTEGIRRLGCAHNVKAAISDVSDLLYPRTH